MLHLLLPLVVGAWLVASAWASDHLVSLLGNVLPDRAWRMVVELLVFAVLLPLPLADELVLTEVDADFDGDAFFPAWDRNAFREISRESHVSDAGWAYHFVVRQRI